MSKVKNQVKKSNLSKKIRSKCAGRPYVIVSRSLNHIYAQFMTPDGARVLASASSLESDIRNQAKDKNGIEISMLVGKKLAGKIENLGYKEIAFNRNIYKFHGRIKAVAESLRENGITF